MVIPLLALLLLGLVSCAENSLNVVDKLANMEKIRPISGPLGLVHLIIIDKGVNSDFSRGQIDFMKEFSLTIAPTWQISGIQLRQVEPDDLDTFQKLCVKDTESTQGINYWVLLENQYDNKKNDVSTKYRLFDKNCQLLNINTDIGSGYLSACYNCYINELLTKKLPKGGGNLAHQDIEYTLGQSYGAGKGSSIISQIVSVYNKRDTTVTAAKIEQQPEQEQVRQQEIVPLIPQPCPSTEPGWIYLKGECNHEHQPNGQGEADSTDKNWHYVGQFQNGLMVNGTFSQNNQTIFVGGMQNGRFEGKGSCRVNGAIEPCEFRKGERIDDQYLQKMASIQAEAIAAKQQQLEEQAVKEQQLEEESARKELDGKIAQCQRDAEDRSGINTTCTCDENGNISCNNHNEGFKALLGVMDDISAEAQASAEASESALNSMIAAKMAEAANHMPQPPKTTVVPPSLSDNERQTIAAEAASNLNTPQPPVVSLPEPVPQPEPIKDKSKSTKRVTETTNDTPINQDEPQGNTEILPEAVALCWKNGGGYWFCDGPLQITEVGEAEEVGLTNVRALSGCSNPRREAGATEDGRTIYLCGFGLDGYDRDLVKIRKLVLPRLSYHCGNQKDRDPNDHKCHQAFTTVEHY